MLGWPFYQPVPILDDMKQDRVLITGASSGIGRALACALARPGTTLILLGRHEARLHAPAPACRDRGAAVACVRLDVTERDTMRAAIEAHAPLDLVFANAGVAYGIRGDGTESEPQVRATFATNVDGVMNTVLPALDVMAGQPPAAGGVRGRIAVIASVAAFLPYPHTPSYCASKAAIDVWTVATAANAARRGVRLTSVCPGFVRTPMTAANDFPMPGLLAVEDAVAVILDGVRRGRRRVVFPRRIGGGARFVSLLPPGLREQLLRRQPSRAPAPIEVEPGA